MRLVLPLLALFTSGCWSAATKTIEDTGDGTEERLLTDDSTDGGGGDNGGGDDGGGPGGDDGGGPGGDDTGTAPPTDLDGDGWSVEEGDCDDDDKRVHPEALDDCDGWDEDCDDLVDEDAWQDDGYEPNDDWGDAVDLGSLDDYPEHSLTGYLHDIGDVDRFQYTISDDDWDFFIVYLYLSDIPDDATYRLTLYQHDGSDWQELGSLYQTGGTLEAYYEDQWLSDDGGTFQVVISADSDPPCDRTYQLDIVHDQY